MSHEKERNMLSQTTKLMGGVIGFLTLLKTNIRIFKIISKKRKRKKNSSNHSPCYKYRIDKFISNHSIRCLYQSNYSWRKGLQLWSILNYTIWLFCRLRSLWGLRLYGTLGYIWFELQKNAKTIQQTF
jgi:hypothetical protein